ncbi:hypothetical protein EVAR_28538_1 [Eumeta japonica]|uniref:BESS domain-containing protein n=1 Tax=Eumeta variegata TaxID=151549 RepID=A0A4C1UX90_EUMVA|nr:hypothetical protein EVAR_28538_1 [Eumeta japonica]
MMKLELTQRNDRETQPKSEDYHFLMSILPQMERLPPIQKIRLRNKINQALLQEMEMTLWTRKEAKQPSHLRSRLLKSRSARPLATTCKKHSKVPSGAREVPSALFTCFIKTSHVYSMENNIGYPSPLLIQSILQRSKLASSELLFEVDRQNIAVVLVQDLYVGNIGELRRYSRCRVIRRMAP